MKIASYSPYLASKGWPAGQVSCAPDLMAALAGAEFVSAHIPKADGPRIGAAELACAMRSGHIAGAGIDAFDIPPSADHPLMGFDESILTLTPQA